MAMQLALDSCAPTALALLLLQGCAPPPEISALEIQHLFSGSGQSSPDIAHRGQHRHLYSDARMRVHNSDALTHSLTSASISIAPRGFGAFNLNGLNELVLQSPHIQVFPDESGGEEAGDNNADSETAEDESDIIDSLNDYVDALPEHFGLVSRIHMRNVRITLHEAGANGSAIVVSASKLLKELGDGSQPELYSVSFLDEQSGDVRHVPMVQWNTGTSQFIVK